MREIKFRAWDGEQMISPDFIARDGRAYWKEHSIPTSTSAVMQYTGLKDKNEKEIYEGDVVRIHNLKHTWKYAEPDFDWRIFAIEYNQYIWAFNNPQIYMPLSTYHDSKDGLYDYDFEVIGNIHENPELLEGK